MTELDPKPKRRLFSRPANPLLSVRLDVLVLGVVLFAWITRFIFLAYPVALGADEWGPMHAGTYPTARTFVSATNPAESWDTVEHFSYGGRILWIIMHMVWAAFYPTVISEANYVLSAIFAVVMFLALAGAAKEAFGQRGLLLGALFASLSPWFLHYSVRTLGTMQSVMWLSLAVYFFARREWKLWHWVLGGLCLGLSFTAHYGTGPAIVSIAAGLALSCTIYLFRGPGNALSRVGKVLYQPIFGAIFAVLPLLVLEAWAAYSGSSYVERLLSHENIVSDFERGPLGMWFRYLLETEPLAQVFIFLGAIYLFAATGIRRSVRVTAAVILLGYLALLCSAMRDALPRAWISLAVFGLIAIVIGLTKLLDRRFLSDNRAGDIYTERAEWSAPMAYGATLVALLVLSILNTGQKSFSSMPRLIFAGYPIYFMVITGFVLLVFRRHFHALVRISILIGVPIYLIGFGAMLYSKSVHPRRSLHARYFPGTKTVSFADFLIWDNALKKLPYRMNKTKYLFGPSHRVYPMISYEEEYHKVREAGLRAEAYGMKGWVTGHEVTGLDTTIVYEEYDASRTLLPPPGTPVLPEEFNLTTSDGIPITPPSDPYRGYEIQFPPATGGTITYNIQVPVPIHEPGNIPFGFEYMITGSGGPTESTVKLTIDPTGMEMSLPLRRGNQMPRLVSGKTQVSEGQPHLQMEITATLETPPDTYRPPVTLYLRRFFAGFPLPPPEQAITSGFSKILAFDEELGGDSGLPEIALYKTGTKADSERVLRWKSAPISGKHNERIATLIQVFSNPTIELKLNGEHILEFEVMLAWEAWRAGDYIIETKYLSLNGSSHLLLLINLPDGKYLAGQTIEQEIRIIPGDTDPDHSAFGVRAHQNAQELLPK